MNRRNFHKLAIAGAVAASALGRLAQAQERAAPIKVTALIHDKMVMMDLAGPLTVFNLLRADVQLVSRDGAPAMTELGIPVPATASFGDADDEADVLFVPGGLAGTVDALHDTGTVDFLAAAGAQAGWVTSVCTGSLLLGAAGLLRDYAATSHWYVRDLLAITGATVSAGRVVEDRTRITGGGVTAGLDFGLHLAARLRGEEMARTIQLVLEYDPEPPFDAGNPAKADPDMKSSILERRSPLIEKARAALLDIGNG